MPKATYMYWQKRFDRDNPDKEIEEKIEPSWEKEAIAKGYKFIKK